MAFLFDLVRRGVFEEITFNRLVVGHTHEDIDALFSIISRHIAGLGIEYEPTVDCFDEAVVAAFKISAATGRTYNEAVLTRIHVTYDWTKYYTPQLDPVWSANALNFSEWHHWRFHMDTASSTFQASYKYFAGAEFQYRTPFSPIQTEIYYADNQVLGLAKWKAVPNNKSTWQESFRSAISNYFEAKGTIEIRTQEKQTHFLKTYVLLFFDCVD